MPPILLVMLGGAVGAGLRYEVGRLALGRFGTGFPWGTLAVNLLGGLAMGALAARVVERGPESGLWLFAAVGVLGGFTTFSAFSLDMFAMVERGQAALALGYAAASVAGAFLLLLLGYWAARGAA